MRLEENLTFSRKLEVLQKIYQISSNNFMFNCDQNQEAATGGVL